MTTNKEVGYWFKGHELQCIFEEAPHKYWLGYYEGENFVKVKELISVTTLMKKHNLVQGYDNVPDYILKRKAERGSLIHKELEEFVKYNKIGFSEEVGEFIEICREKNIKPLKSEYIVFNDVVAGTVDLACLFGGVFCKADYKTTASYDENYLSWQLSIYNYLDQDKDQELKCFHFNNGLKIYDVKPIETEEIENLLNCERNGEIYQAKIKNIAFSEDVTQKLIRVQNNLKEIEEQKKFLEAQKNEMENFIKSKMEEANIKQINNDYFKITLTPEGTTTGIDTARLKKERPEIAEEYKKVGKRKSYLTITIKGEN